MPGGRRDDRGQKKQTCKAKHATSPARGLRARCRVLGLAPFLGSLSIARQAEVIGLPQQTLTCAMVVMAARAQLPQAMLAGVIRGYMHVRQENGRGQSGMLAVAVFLSDAIGVVPAVLAACGTA